MDPQLVEAHKAYLRAYRELKKEKFHESYTKYVTTNKAKIKEYQQNSTTNTTTKETRKKKSKSNAHIMLLKNSR